MSGQLLMIFKYAFSARLNHLFLVKGGRPNSSGWNSSRDLRTSVASSSPSIGKRLSGVITHCIFPALAPFTPFGASSNTKHDSGFGLSGNFFAASRKMSGAGLPFKTSPDVTMWWISLKSSGKFETFNWAASNSLLVAIAIGILLKWKCDQSFRSFY